MKLKVQPTFQCMRRRPWLQATGPRLSGLQGAPSGRSRRLAITPQAAVKQTFRSFEDMIQQSDVPVLVDFYAVWCGPCQMMSGMLGVSCRTLSSVAFFTYLSQRLGWSVTQHTEFVFCCTWTLP